MTANPNFRKHHRHGLFAGQISPQVPGPAVRRPGEGASTSPSRSRRDGASGLAHGPCGRPPPAARCSALPPWTPGGLGAPPPRTAHGKGSGARLPTAGAGRPSRHRELRGRRGEAGSSPRGRLQGPGPRVGGRRGTCFTAAACEAEGGASVAGRGSGAHPRSGREGLRGAPILGGTRRHKRGAERRAGGAGAALPSPAGQTPKRHRKLVLAPALTCAARGAAAAVGAPPPPPQGAGRQERTLPRRGDRSCSSPGRLGSWSAGETP